MKEKDIIAIKSKHCQWKAVLTPPHFYKKISSPTFYDFSKISPHPHRLEIKECSHYVMTTIYVTI